jgi:hypothetical protein
MQDFVKKGDFLRSATQDLRTLIGLFFGTLSFVLFLASLKFPSHANHSLNLNQLGARTTFCFALVMIFLGTTLPQKAIRADHSKRL